MLVHCVLLIIIECYVLEHCVLFIFIIIIIECSVLRCWGVCICRVHGELRVGGFCCIVLFVERATC